MKMPVNSPFKFLDAYGKEDKQIFFGRKDEVELLYDLVFQSNLTLIYGESGTGKTSLVQCGLANRFAVTDWFNVYIRRNEDINQSLVHTLKRYEVKEEDLWRENPLRQRLMKKREGVKRIPVAKESQQSDFIRSLRSIYKHFLKPVFLIFDQFEELFILGTRGEQQLFYYTIAHILETEPYCRVILIMREESIAQLYDFEKIVPQLFDKRLRVESMGRANTQEVITRSSKQFGITLQSKQIPEQIIDVLSAGQGRVELTYLQVFLDQLYQQAAQKNEKEIIFTADLIKRLGNIEDVLGDFLNRQTLELQAQAEKKFPELSPAAVRKTLNAFVTLEGTKRPVRLEDLRIGKIPSDQIAFVVKQLEKNRILRFEDHLYELSHDALAKQVANARSADEVALLQIARIVKDRYQVYDTTKTLLNTNELQLTGSFRKRLDEEHALSAEEWAFVKKSLRFDRRRRFSLAAMVLAIIAILATFAGYSYLQGQKIQEESYKTFLLSGNNMMKDYKYREAQEAYQNALKINDTGQEAKDSLLAAAANIEKSSRFDELLLEGNTMLSSGNPENLLDARKKFAEAQLLGIKQDSVAARLAQLRVQEGKALIELKSDAEFYFKAGESGNPNGYATALEKYVLALSFDPNDSELKQQIEVCERRLNRR